MSGKLVAAGLVLASVLFELWLAASWLNVILTNSDPQKVAAAWNFFVIVF